MKRVVINEKSNHNAGQVGTIIGRNSIGQYEIELDNGKILTVEWFYFDEYIEEEKEEKKEIKVGTVIQSLTGKKQYISTVYKIVNLSNGVMLWAYDEKGKHHGYTLENENRKFKVLKY